jgi:hypothetical protein
LARLCRRAAGFGIEEAAPAERGIAHEPGRRDVSRIFPPPHQAGDFIDFDEAVHPAPQPELVAVLPRAKISVAAYAKPAERLSAELAASCIHFRVNYR